MGGEQLERQAIDAMERVAKWRVVLAGWQLGTREKGDPECDAVRDHRELAILTRVEISSIIALLLEKKVFSRSEWLAKLIEEADALSDLFEKRFPGIRATIEGIEMDPLTAAETMRGWKP